jgi:hypothetical protein
MYMGTYVGSLLGTVRLEFYATEQTERLVRAPAAAVVGGPRWHYIGGDGARATSTSTFPAEAPATATIELTLSGHGQGGEFWYLENPVPRAFHVLVDGTEVAVARALPYVYALAGTGNGCANGECGCGAYGTTSTGQRLHAAAWWTGQQALDVAGVHTGDGEIPPYRVDLDAASLATLTGARTVEVVQEGGSGNWLTSLTFLLR